MLSPLSDLSDTSISTRSQPRLEDGRDKRTGLGSPQRDDIQRVEAMTTSQAPSVGTRLVALLRPNSLNPRGDVDASGLDELAESIRAQGVLQPLLITPDGLVVAGHRRLAAARMAGRDEVPVVIRDLDPVQQQEIMLAMPRLVRV
jgi:ParB family chromosome partitioning protein